MIEETLVEVGVSRSGEAEDDKNQQLHCFVLRQSKTWPILLSVVVLGRRVGK